MQDNPQQALHYAYLAGLFDGEGTFCIGKKTRGSFMTSAKRKNPVYLPIVRIGMSCKEAIDHVLEIFPFGCTYCEGVRKDQPTHKIMYRWEQGGTEKCALIINSLLPYLRVKKAQALLVKELCDGWKIPRDRSLGVDPEELQRREDLYRQVRKLNRVGAAATTN